MKLQAGLALTALLSLWGATSACTSIGVGKLASTDGSTFATHTADSKTGDFRAIRVPRNYHLGAERPVYPGSLTFPRYVGSSRGKNNYKPRDGEEPTKPIGYIPETNRSYTYAYYDAIYGVVNEAGLGIGESTCGGKIFAAIRPNGKALMTIDELTRTALERCATARCAVELMGDLAYNYGFAAAEPVAAEAGEALVVNDREEVWVFHVTAGDFEGRHGVWVAQRLPHDHITVVPNFFVIGKVNLADTDNYLASPNLFSAAKENGLWKEEDGEFEFNKVYGNDPMIYSSRRWWRVFSLAAPSLALPATQDYYPFSVKVEKKVSAEDLMWMNRDHFEGTPYDLTASVGGGPFGMADRWENEPRLSWERAISIHRTLYSTVIQARPHKPGFYGTILWFGFDSPHASAYTPVYAGSEGMGKPYSTGSQLLYTSDSMWWVNNLLSNYLNLRYKCIIGDIQTKIREVETRAFQEIEEVDRKVAKAMEKDEEHLARRIVSEYTERAAVRLHREWQELSSLVFTKYNDGYVNLPTVGADSCAYPVWWHDLQIQYDAQKLASPAPSEISAESSSVDIVKLANSTSSHLFGFLCALVGLVAGAFLGAHVSSRRSRSGYAVVP